MRPRRFNRIYTAQKHERGAAPKIYDVWQVVGRADERFG
jgi:hypothetical protein